MHQSNKVEVTVVFIFSADPAPRDSKAAAVPAVVQQLLAQSGTQRHSTGHLSDREKEVLVSLPDLSFMTAKVLMFPVAGDS